MIDWGGKIGTHGADVISVTRTGEVYLWDNKVRNSGSEFSRSIQESPTFVDGDKLRNAVAGAKEAILASDLPQVVKAKALANLETQSFQAITVGDGFAARNSTISDPSDLAGRLKG